MAGKRDTWVLLFNQLPPEPESGLAAKTEWIDGDQGGSGMQSGDVMTTGTHLQVAIQNMCGHFAFTSAQMTLHET